MQKVRISLDDEQFTVKPKGKIIGAIVERIASKPIEIPVEDLAIAQVKGQTTAPLFRNGEKDNEHWIGQQVFFLDFDQKPGKKTTLDIVLARCREYGITPAYAYETFDPDLVGGKFRVVFVLPVIVEDVLIRNVIQESLTVLFPEHDTSINTPHMMVFGGLSLLYSDYNATLNIMNLVRAVCVWIQVNDKNDNAARQIKAFCQSVGLDMINGRPYITCEENDVLPRNTPIYNRVLNLKTSKITFYFQSGASDRVAKQDKPKYNKPINTSIKHPLLIHHPEWSELCTCPVFTDFMNGIDIHHNVTWFLATNLAWIRGGEDRFFEGLRKRETYDESKWIAQFNDIKKAGYMPANYTFIRQWYPDVEFTTRNLIDLARKDRTQIKMITQQDEIEIQDAEKRLQAAFNTALQTPLGTVNVLRADVGLGKSRLFMGIKNATIAVPTHTLKTQHAQDMRASGNEVFASPELPELPEDIKNAIDAFYAVGNIRGANIFIRNEAKNNADLAEYVTMRDMITRSTGVNVLVTHAHLPFLETTNDTIIIDEDILPTLLQQSDVSERDLTTLREFLRPKGFNSNKKDKTAIESAFDYVINADPGLLFPMPVPLISRNELKDLENTVKRSPVKTNVLGLLSARYFVKDPYTKTIHYITKRTLPNKRIIVLSATASEWMYKKVFGERLRFVDIGRVKTKGKIKQIPDINATRYALDKDPKNAEIINKIVGNIPSITHKEYKHLFENAKMHFGAALGSNSLEGKDIAVIGTPHFNIVAYLLLASVLGVETNALSIHASFYSAKIVRNGFEFHIMTYGDDPALQEIQLHMLESELQQAIGRARHLRNDVVVLVFSNLPIPGAEIYYYSKDDVMNLFARNA